MLTHSDVQLLDNAFANLGDTFARNRQMKQQQANYQQEQQRLGQQAQALAEYRQGEQALKGQQLSDEEMYRQMTAQNAADRLAEDKRYHDAQIAQAGQKESDLTTRLKQNTIKFHDQQIQEIKGDVAKGVLSPEQGTAMIKQGVSKWDDWEKQTNPLYAQYSDPGFSLQAKPTPTKPLPGPVQSTHQVPNPNYTPGGTEPQMLTETNLTTHLPPANAPTAPETAAPPTISSAQQYDALPAGSKYYGSDGKLRVKKASTDAVDASRQ